MDGWLGTYRVVNVARRVYCMGLYAKDAPFDGVTMDPQGTDVEDFISFATTV